jgi:hypothetical protein
MGNGFIPHRPPFNQSTPSTAFNLTAFLDSFATYYGIPSFLFPGYYQMGNFYQLSTTTTTTTVASTGDAIAGVVASSTASPLSTDNQPCNQLSAAELTTPSSYTGPPPTTTYEFDGILVTETSSIQPSKPSNNKPTPPIGLPLPPNPISTIFFPSVSSDSSSSSSSSSSDGSVSSGGITGGSVTSSGSTISVTGFLLFFFFIALPIIFGCLTLLEIPFIVSGVLVLAVVPLTLILFLKVSGAFHGRKHRNWNIDWKRILSEPDDEMRRLEQDVWALLDSFPYREMEVTTTEVHWNHLDDDYYSR